MLCIVSDLISWGIDFGFAARLSDTNACSGDCGSILYVAPEVLVYSNQIYDGTKADIWSMGKSFFCLKLETSGPTQQS